MPSRLLVYGMSRSGTTLLTTVLDAHPALSMGYELLTKDITDAEKAAALIEQSSPEDARACSAALDAASEHQLSALVHRADRCLVSPVELAGILRHLAAEGHTDLTPLKARLTVAQAIVDAKSTKEGTSGTGFKLNVPRIGAVDELLNGDAAYVFIVRDPRAIWASHVANNFDRSVEEVARTWVSYLRTFDAFAASHPDRTHLLRYEDLVSDPETTIRAMSTSLAIEYDPAMENFYESKASVLRGGHVNSDNLQRDFFTESVDRWRASVSDDDLWTLETHCHDGMHAHGYPKLTDSGFRFAQGELVQHRQRLAKKRRYGLMEYGALVLPAVQRFTPLTWAEATAPSSGAKERPREVLMLRHDIDNDLENAVRLARWEAEHGIRATYCVLHTAWYYRRSRPGTTEAPSEQMIEACQEIQALGHEINLHNNTIVRALRTGRDPYDILAEELALLRGRGLHVTGTSTHGDKLCGELGFQNLELFSETVYPARGGARTVKYDGHRVEIGTRSMEEFDLDYEGYDLPRDVYVTDSGGHLRVVTDTAGRGGLPRSELSPEAVPYDRIVGILTHPVWWDLDGSGPQPREELSFDALAGPHLRGRWTALSRLWRR